MEDKLCLGVKYQLSGEFRSLAESIQGCRVLNVVEIKSCEILQFIIECPLEKQNTIVDCAFMTWIKNPVFQKYYSASNNFKAIADNYVNNRIMNRLEQLSFDELFNETDDKQYKSADEIALREKEIIDSLKKPQSNTFNGIKLNCELLALCYLKKMI